MISTNDTYSTLDKAFVESLNQTRVSGPLPIQIVSAVADHITTVTEPSINPDAQRFEQVAVGGTFDHIHAGHKILLAMTALLASKRLACGITGIG
jgi:pantetheine-phosphate adenylyltransferase